MVGLPTRFTIEREADIVQSSQNYLVTPASLDLVQSKPPMHTKQVFVSPGALQEHIVEYNQRVFVGKGRPIAAEKDSLNFVLPQFKSLQQKNLDFGWNFSDHQNVDEFDRFLTHNDEPHNNLVLYVGERYALIGF